MVEEIKAKLQEIDENVYYGAGKFEKRDLWDCIVFGKKRIKRVQNTAVYVWFVAIVREEEIPEGLPEKVIEKVRELGLKQTDANIEFGYTEKSAECMVEICTIEFFKSKKGC